MAEIRSKDAHAHPNSANLPEASGSQNIETAASPPSSSQPRTQAHDVVEERQTDSGRPNQQNTPFTLRAPHDTRGVAQDAGAPAHAARPLQANLPVPPGWQVELAGPPPDLAQHFNPVLPRAAPAQALEEKVASVQAGVAPYREDSASRLHSSSQRMVNQAMGFLAQTFQAEKQRWDHLSDHDLPLLNAALQTRIEQAQVDAAARAVRQPLPVAAGEVPPEISAHDPRVHASILPAYALQEATRLVERRTALELRRFGAVSEKTFASPEEEATALLGVANSIADTLRRYTQQLPDQVALRFGLFLVKTYLEREDVEVSFHPPELSGAS